MRNASRGTPGYKFPINLVRTTTNDSWDTAAPYHPWRPVRPNNMDAESADLPGLNTHVWLVQVPHLWHILFLSIDKMW